MPVKIWHPLTPENPTAKVIPVTASATTLFHKRQAKYGKYTENRVFSTTAHPPYVPSTYGQQQSMHPLTLRILTEMNIPRHRKRHNSFAYPPR
jgi:hypothetical protein